jgi:hypothetical protein
MAASVRGNMRQIRLDIGVLGEPVTLALGLGLRGNRCGAQLTLCGDHTLSLGLSPVARRFSPKVF